MTCKVGTGAAMEIGKGRSYGIDNGASHRFPRCLCQRRAGILKSNVQRFARLCALIERQVDTVFFPTHHVSLRLLSEH